jgi:hypothetical protein
MYHEGPLSLASVTIQPKGYTMKRLFPFALAAVCLSLHAADSSPKASLTSAIKSLSDQANYSWKTTVEVPEDSRFHPGPTEGKTEKSGLTYLVMHFGDNTSDVVLKGKKGAVSREGQGWQSLSELEDSQGPMRFFAIVIRNFKAPAAEAAQLVSDAKEIKQDEPGVYSGDLTADGVKKLVAWHRPGGGEGPEVSNPSGSVRFWLTGGALNKYQFKVKGTMSFNGNDFDIDRTTTVEIKDAGTTKLKVPEEARNKMS